MKPFNFEELAAMTDTKARVDSDDEFTAGQQSIHTPNMHLCLSSFEIEDMKIGDVYECTRSSVAGRKGERFEVKKNIDAEMLEHFMAYGDRFDRVKRGMKKVRISKR